MPVAPIAVDPDVYASAAALFLDVGAAVCDVVAAAATAAGGGGGLAGTDSGGVAWAAAYDAAAAAALRSGALLADGVGHLGTLLDRSGGNHADAETASVAGGPPHYPGGGGGGGSGGSAASVVPATPPSANGTGDDPPAGWFLIAHLLQHAWPNGHQDRLRAVAAGWHAAAEGFTAAADRLSGPIGDISAMQSPEVDAAVAVCCRAQQSARSLSEQCTALGHACSDYAAYLDDAHAKVVAELAALAVESAAIQVVAALTAVPTGGGSEVAGQVAQVARTAVSAARVSEFLAELVRLVAAVTDLVTDVIGRLQAVDTQLQMVLARNADLAPVAGAPAVAVVDLAAAELAGGHTIARHVGRTDEYLRSRNKKYASTFNDLPTAQTMTAQNLSANTAKVAAWLAGNEPTIDIEMPADGSMGRIYVRASGICIAPTKVVTVLQRGPNGYFVLTSYLGV